MSTQTSPVQDLAVIEERFTRVVCQPKNEVNDKGETTTPDIVIFSNEEDADKFVADGKGTILFKQTFSYSKANTDAGVVEICPVERERVKLFNNGASVKVQNKAKSLLGSKDDEGNYDFEPVEVYSLDEYLAKETAMRGAATFNKLLDQVQSGKLTPEQRDALMQLLAAE